MSDDPELAAIRARIDEVDARLCRLLEERVALVREAAALKAARGVPLLDPGREEAIVRRAAGRTGLSEASVRAAFAGILEACKRGIAGPPAQPPAGAGVGSSSNG